MQISVLTDNRPGPHTKAEHGLSYLVEHDGKRILFDTGQSDLFLENAGIMGITPDHLDAIVLSHGHFDHGNGLHYLHGGQLVCHPGCFVRRYRKSDYSYIGLRHSREELKRVFDLVTSTGPYRLSSKIMFLGEIPRITLFESHQTSFVFEDGEPDFVMDDSGLALMTPEGLFVITGCGHAGIVNTLIHAQNVTGEKRILGIMGGFHLKHANLQTKETIHFLLENQVKHVYPSHCTEEPAMELFDQHFGEHRIRTGDILTI